jgi:hypothetical protein
MDAPDTVQDGMQWYADEDDADLCGPVPRLVELREPPNAELTRRQRPQENER